MLKPGMILCDRYEILDVVEDDEIRDIVSEEDDLDRITQELVDRANYYGGSDNISVIIISAE